jgi:hypothetical protein
LRPSPGDYYQIGLCYREAKDGTEARKYFRRCLADRDCQRDFGDKANLALAGLRPADETERQPLEPRAAAAVPITPAERGVPLVGVSPPTTTWPGVVGWSAIAVAGVALASAIFFNVDYLGARSDYNNGDRSRKSDLEHDKSLATWLYIGALGLGAGGVAVLLVGRSGELSPQTSRAPRSWDVSLAWRF